MLGFYRDNGKEAGSYYLILGLCEPLSKLLVSPLITPIVLPYNPLYNPALRSLDYGSCRDDGQEDGKATAILAHGV